MTDDELVNRLRDFDPHLHEWEVVDEAADRIEQLTAELSACTESPGGCGYWRERSKVLTAERDARIDPAHVQDLINAAEPMFAEAYAAAATERDVLNKMLDYEDRPGPRRDALIDALARLNKPIDPR